MTMFEQKKDAHFGGVSQGPFFPDGIDKLNELYQKVQPNSEILGIVGRRQAGWDYLEQLPVSSDNTPWLASLELNFGKSDTVSVVFPHKGATHSIAFYVTGNGKNFMAGILAQLRESLAEFQLA